MREEFYYNSCGAGRIHGCRWVPEGEIRGIVQIIHGIAEYALRYEPFAEFLNAHGYLVVAEDHMGHGKSVGSEGTYGYFSGGWFAAVRDSYHLMVLTRRDYPDLPYILFGHSMGSFLARTMLIRYPDCGLTGCMLCGTGALPNAMLQIGLKLAKQACRNGGEAKPSLTLQNLMFGTFNLRVDHPRTPSDWLSRDPQVVDAYEKDPLCGFISCPGLFRDMITGMLYNQQPANLACMNRQLPVRFIAGKDDPVGAYGAGVQKVMKAFQDAGMVHVTGRLYPLCRHELLNELNKEEIYQDVLSWFDGLLADR